MRLISMLILCCVLPAGAGAQLSNTLNPDVLDGPLWPIPTVSFSRDHLYIRCEDTVLASIEHISLFAGGLEFVAKEFEIEPWLRWRRSSETEGGMLIITSTRLAPEQVLPLTLFRHQDRFEKDSYLSGGAKPDSAYVYGSFTDHVRFFERLRQTDGGVYERVSWFLALPNGGMLSDPLDHPPPRDFLRRRAEDI